ncbi:sugar phosphate isomerase/epimerase family protein [Glaciecola siphonariae]|uniref:Sugar phosphate isomerase/epimerase family protein n=1 Tax=Glaciecola siphonariae TaxID=521012 RepID=A0ABV9LSP8_9ALTE
MSAPKGFTRRQFNSALLYGSAALALSGCSDNTSAGLDTTADTASATYPPLKLSLAQWALQTAQFGSTFNDNYEQWQMWLKTDPAKVLQGELSPMLFPEYVQQTFAIDAVDFVNTFYFDQVSNDAYWAELRQRCSDNNIVANNIMLDQEGYLGHNNAAERLQAVENHKKWIDIAAKLNCASVRVNAHGIGDWNSQLESALESCTALADYAKANNIVLLVENHGGLSSNADWLVALMEQANHPALQVFLDYDNFKWSETEIWQTEQVYDRYEGVEKLMPYTHSVSVKTYEFDEAGNETTIDVPRMLEIAKRNNFAGYHSVEFEGHKGDPVTGIKQTRDLLLRAY